MTEMGRWIRGYLRYRNSQRSRCWWENYRHHLRRDPLEEEQRRYLRVRNYSHPRWDLFRLFIRDQEFGREITSDHLADLKRNVFKTCVSVYFWSDSGLHMTFVSCFSSQRTTQTEETSIIWRLRWHICTGQGNDGKRWCKKHEFHDEPQRRNKGKGGCSQYISSSNFSFKQGHIENSIKIVKIIDKTFVDFYFIFLHFRAEISSDEQVRRHGQKSRDKIARYDHHTSR